MERTYLDNNVYASLIDDVLYLETLDGNGNVSNTIALEASTYLLLSNFISLMVSNNDTLH